jgi:hypothetical protein
MAKTAFISRYSVLFWQTIWIYKLTKQIFRLFCIGIWKNMGQELIKDTNQLIVVTSICVSSFICFFAIVMNIIARKSNALIIATRSYGNFLFQTGNSIVVREVSPETMHLVYGKFCTMISSSCHYFICIHSRFFSTCFCKDLVSSRTIYIPFTAYIWFSAEAPINFGC